MQICRRLPRVGVSWKAPTILPQAEAGSDEEEQTEKSLLKLTVTLKRDAPAQKKGKALSRVYAPRFPKVGSLSSS